MKFFSLLLIGFSLNCLGQKTETYKIRSIAFYNVENLFDTVNDPLVFDDERTPGGQYVWNELRYQQKIENISTVISAVGQSVTGSSPDIIGLCEVENFKVLQDLVKHPKMIDFDYGIVHYDSPDDRGIDVALLFKKSAFLPTSSKSHRLLLFDEDGFRDYTRDQLVVSGYLDEEEIHFIVNHWPSRRGGEARSQPLRVKAAQLTKRIIDSLQRNNQTSKIIAMGDFNDDPKNISIKKVLKARGRKNKLDSTSLFNPMEKLFKKGYGTLAYRDKWNLFDQLLLTPNLLGTPSRKYLFWKAGIFNPKYLQNKSGPYKGYPFRAYVGTSYQGGYSDHFPVFLFLIKKVD